MIGGGRITDPDFGAENIFDTIRIGIRVLGLARARTGGSPRSASTAGILRPPQLRQAWRVGVRDSATGVLLRARRYLLIENIAWAARHLPFFPLPNGPRYRFRPIHVDDHGARGGRCRRRRIEFGDLVDYLASLIGRAGPCRPAAGSCLRRALPACVRFHARDDSHH